MKYLKNRQYYIDLYDRSTVEQCRRALLHKVNINSIQEKARIRKIKDFEVNRAIKVAEELHIYFLTGDRYMKREEVVRKWMERDEAHDKFQEKVVALEEITCLTCGRLMFVSSQHMDIGYDGKPDRMLFFYDCPLEHIPRRAFYDNGEEFRREKPNCPKCMTRLTEVDKHTKKKLIVMKRCVKCGHQEKYELELGKKDAELEVDPEYEKDRLKFCLSEKDGQDFIRAKIEMESASKFMDEWNEKQKNKEVYNKVANLKKLKILELEELLVPVLESAGYIKLQFKNPEITQDVVAPFTVYEQRSDREGRSSTYELERLLRKTLKDTNWRLMADGTNYRLGMLEGRLHGYEKEKDLLRLVKESSQKK